MRFSDLLDPGSESTGRLEGIAESQRRAGRLFPEVARGHGFKLLDRTRPMAALGSMTIIGVAAEWAVLDMELLDDLSAAGRDWAREPVELIDVSGVEGSLHLEGMSPGCTQVAHTPVVIRLESGRVVQTKVGKRARDYLRSAFLPAV